MDSEENYWCFNKVPVYFLTMKNFKLKREQEIAVESMLMNQDVLVVLPTAYELLQTYVINCKRATKQREGDSPFTIIIKD